MSLTTALPFTIEFTTIPNFADSILEGVFAIGPGVYFDFTGMTFVMNIGTQRSYDSTPAYLATLKQADGDITPMSNGVIQFRFRPEKIGTLEQATYKLDLIATKDGRQISFAIGKLGIIDRAIA